ncbi:unnamed protein product [Adineta steineri]|uniref:Uncharacterized protein n=1 Tax=Adineta steineri TaxID=433720 RepID=A0A819DUP6_9BILA|nr:unnamed protein product [Adineta steineri]CAF0996886.1 unnamed protein product [Adineta steineri]CAF3839086.1 unnamed protein product [Adineta steineri]CAF3908297.1 unnamed protein product [Adineta steineri]
MAQNDLHKKHKDGHFAAVTIRFTKDDKCKIPIGLPAAKKQAPLLMHLDYVIKLPDHDFVLAPRHQFIPR